MLSRIKEFLRGESGAVTVDWVVLTAAVVALAGAAITSIQGGASSVGTATGDHLSNVQVGAGN